MAAKISSTFPDINIIKQISQSNLIHALEVMPGKKDLVIDPDLMRPTDKFAGASVLKKHGVTKIYKMEPDVKTLPGCDQRIYLVRAKVVTMKYIADQINNEKKKGDYRTYKILMVPRKLKVCETILENEGVYGEVTIDDLPLNMFVLDTDLITLELPLFFRSFYLDGDETWLHTVAQSLVTLLQVFGQIPNVHMIGSAAKTVWDLVAYLQSCDDRSTHSSKDCTFGHIFIIDREVDYMTALCSQVTYEGLLDETFGINSGIIEFSHELTGGECVKLHLSSQDPTYAQARDHHFTNVFTLLSSKITDVQTGYDKRHALKTVGDMKTFVGEELRGLKSQHKTLTHHISASEIMMAKKIKEDFNEVLQVESNIMEGINTKETIAFIEECINRQLSYDSTLRLLCLMSLTCDGIPTKDYESLKTQFLHSHGFEHMLTWYNLKKLGLLTEQIVHTPTASISNLMMSKRSTYNTISKKLNLVPDTDIDLNNPTDMSYVFGGEYTPLTCSLIENGLLQHNYMGLEDVLRLLPGGMTVYPAQPVPGPHVVLVCFIGGCTYVERAALRLLALKLGYQFLVVTTAMINGMSVIESATERINLCTTHS